MKKYDFQPDYTNIVKAARNIEAPRLPLYDHDIAMQQMENVLGRKFSHLSLGNDSDLLEYYKEYCEFYKTAGYDVAIIEYALNTGLPGSGALAKHIDPAIKTYSDLEKYPFDEAVEIFFNTYDRHLKALREALPEGMKALGGCGYGVFELAQDLTGYMNLCYIREDDPEMYEELFKKVGEYMLTVWSRLLEKYSDVFCVCRFGDDLGFKTMTLLPADDIRKYVIPGYKKIIDVVHKYNKPFLLHSCGQIFEVMDDIINIAGIDAKHSNEDTIATFDVWVDRYGDRIGNFGGIDTDAVCQLSPVEIREYILELLKKCQGKGGIAFGTGNSVPDYVPLEGYVAMRETIRDYRGDKIR